VNARALRAVVSARLRADVRALVFVCVAAAVVGALRPTGLGGPIAFGTVVAIGAALMQIPGRVRYLDVCERGAPLFGRELARAKAAAPCTTALLAVAAYCFAAEAAGMRGAAVVFVATAAAVVPAALTALSATLRSGSARWLYVAAAIAVSAAAFFLAAIAGSTIGELAFAAVVSFVALRQYGEALARHDPI